MNRESKVLNTATNNVANVTNIVALVTNTSLQLQNCDYTLLILS